MVKDEQSTLRTGFTTNISKRYLIMVAYGV